MILSGQDLQTDYRLEIFSKEVKSSSNDFTIGRENIGNQVENDFQCPRINIRIIKQRCFINNVKPVLSILRWKDTENQLEMARN